MSRRSHGRKSGADWPRALDRLHQPLRRRAVDVDERDASALGAQVLDDGGADAAAAAGDEGDATVQAGVGREPVHGALRWLDVECRVTLTQTAAVLGSRERHGRHHAARGRLRSSAGSRGRRDGHALLARARARACGSGCARRRRWRCSARRLRGRGLSARAVLEPHPRGRFRFDGRDVALPLNRPPERHAIHGQGWQATWTAREVSTTSALLEFRHAPDAWPWAYRATQRFVLSPANLTVELALRERERRTDAGRARLASVLSPHAAHDADRAGGADLADRRRDAAVGARAVTGHRAPGRRA